jgi:tetratricopeptide (TPR) repeat protein
MCIIESAIVHFSPISTIAEKSEDKSIKLRETGNNFYIKGNYIKALECFNASIAVAPTDSKTLSLAFANRSVTLQAVGHYTESFDDLQRCLELGYPEELQYKIYLRLGHSYKLQN